MFVFQVRQKSSHYQVYNQMLALAPLLDVAEVGVCSAPYGQYVCHFFLWKEKPKCDAF